MLSIHFWAATEVTAISQPLEAINGPSQKLSWVMNKTFSILLRSLQPDVDIFFIFELDLLSVSTHTWFLIKTYTIYIIFYKFVLLDYILSA